MEIRLKNENNEGGKNARVKLQRIFQADYKQHFTETHHRSTRIKQIPSNILHSVFKPLCHPTPLGQHQRHQQEKKCIPTYLYGNLDKKGKLKNKGTKKSIDEKKQRSGSPTLNINRRSQVSEVPKPQLFQDFNYRKL